MTPALKSRIHALVPAGGVGARAVTDPVATPKQYRMIHDKPMIQWALQALLSDARIDRVWVGVQPDDRLAEQYLGSMARVSVLPSAGATRALTVLQTLVQSALPPEDWVLVHDAARPGLPASALTALIDACLENHVGGILAMPAADTVKLAQPVKAGDAASIDRTLPRQAIWLAQTPQMFPVGQLVSALQGALAEQFEVTDEASAMEWAGHRPLLVPGSARNHKVTWPEDFALMKGLL
jgi:2-C-methyl-D-erythritol 4-phosphate cytidylyltransferase